jgi:hypothetical protein
MFVTAFTPRRPCLPLGLLVGLAALPLRAAPQSASPPACPTAAPRLTFPTLSLAPQSQPADETAAPLGPPTPPADEPEKPFFRKLFTFSLSYTLLSDYVSRGIIYSDYPQEGREKLNHQMSTELGLDIATLLNRAEGTCGQFTFTTWFDWFAEQDRIDPLKGQRELAEVDYTLSWTYEVKPLHTTTTIGYAFYVIPSWVETNTQEWYFSLEHNDAWMWKWLLPENDEPVLKPYYALYYDTDLNCGAIWMDVGFSHDFTLFDDLTITPSLDFGIDHRFLGPTLGLNEGTTRLATIQYGLTLSYDLTKLLHFDRLNAGTISISGSLYFSDAVGSAARRGEIRDHWFGGPTLTWSF